MKKIVLFFVATMFAVSCFAQQELAFPFQGGKEVMNSFFKQNIDASSDIVKRKVTGTAVFKFTADTVGAIKKIIIYYADDVSMVTPIIEALKKSDGKWIIPFGEKAHDFIIPFKINFKAPATASVALQKAVYDFHRNSKPVLSNDQVPLDVATLLPAVSVIYEIN